MNDNLMNKKNAISPLEYKLNKERLNKMGYSPEHKNVVLSAKFP